MKTMSQSLLRSCLSTLPDCEGLPVIRMEAEVVSPLLQYHTTKQHIIEGWNSKRSTYAISQEKADPAESECSTS